jgi:tetratricopeptide (TPR) repeat protein
MALCDGVSPKGAPLQSQNGGGATPASSWSEDEEELEEAEIIADSLFCADDDEEFETAEQEFENLPLASRAPLSTVTLAEIYFAQGFYDQALRIYEELFLNDPGNMALLRRINEIEALSSAPFFPLETPKTSVSEPPGVMPPPPLAAELARGSHKVRIIATLEQMLAGIKRRQLRH